MTDFIHYQNGSLHIEDVCLETLAKTLPTPFYAYSQNTITDAYEACAQAFKSVGIDMDIHYAVKANTNPKIIELLAQKGAGGDVVSGGELMIALKGGIQAENIIFSGVGKTQEELELALDKKIGQINVESINELKLLNELALKKNIIPNVTLRVNPDVDADTHERITTGRRHDKFGIDFEQVPEVYRMGSDMTGINLCGMAVHIGSQIFETNAFRDAYQVLKEIAYRLRKDGMKVERLDLGGGIGTDYADCRNKTDFTIWAQAVQEVFKNDDFKLAIEPGRSLVAQSGVVVTRSIYIKENPFYMHKFLILDAAMNDLIRPSLYDAYHHILPVNEPISEDIQTYDIVGPICESTDAFAKNRALPIIEEGDLVVIGSAGAYGHVMASTYNMRPIPAEILVNGAQHQVIRERTMPY